ncbi:hypothetical protein ASG11_07805 [Sphingomonas sp. Leaf357]|uniref:retropepsin-like aspartic protease family protein n=1 Tax=Sphingomonas sp. Leaf357 TaxID=1736350 RepID=UPI0006F6531F|nr:TIGR02281 family clan AA aspartic protease [Sphingomonas sp. Leaf357]KQS04165.1 hypothetical protein ASG11_07805 [Sphingomonas sp. Leaf357]
MVSTLPSLCSLGTAVLLFASVNLGGEDSPHGEGTRLQANAAIADQAVTDLPALARPDDRIRIAKASDGLFYVRAKVNGTPVRFLVDTGANLVVLTAADARRVGAAAGAAHLLGDIETAGGTSRMGRVTLDRVTVAGRDLADVDAAVMHNGLKVSLMGQNLLAKLGPIMLSADEMSLQKDR